MEAGGSSRKTDRSSFNYYSTFPDRSLLVRKTGVPGSWDMHKVTCDSDHIFHVHSPPGAHVHGHPCASSVACGFSLSNSTKTPDQ